MKLSNEVIFNSPEGLNVLMALDLPTVVGFRLAELAIALRPALEAIGKARDRLVYKYGQEQESGEVMVIFPSDKLKRPISPDHKKFREEERTLLATLTEVKFKKVKLPEMVDGKPFRVAPNVLYTLEKFLDF